MFKELRSAVKLAHSMQRIADALEEQNRIHKIELSYLHNITIPDPKRKWTKKELETEISYDTVLTPEEEQAADDWAEQGGWPFGEARK